MSNVTILHGDCLQSLQSLQGGSANTCITSPPYYGLRDYGHANQIGLEATPGEYIENLVSVFREVRRVLRDDGTLWLNIGDSYATRFSGNNGFDDGRVNRNERRAAGVPDGLKNKDLIGIPWMLAFALRADGWYLRQDIIWQKPNPMPESVRDRCTKAHEYVFLLSKSEKYHFDHERFKEPAKDTKGSGNKARKQRPSSESLNRGAQAGSIPWEPTGLRNRRSVWNIPTQRFKEAHFATFPPSLVEPCILATCPAGGVAIDPFGGSGTTAGVAVANGCDAILCELNPSYAAMTKARVMSLANIPETELQISEVLAN